MDIKKGDVVVCFPDDGTQPQQGKVLTLLTEVKGNKPEAFIVGDFNDADKPQVKKTWLAEQVLRKEDCPPGLLVIIEDFSAPKQWVGFGGEQREWLGSNHGAGPGEEVPDLRPATGPGLKENEEPLFLAFDATGVPEELKAKALGRPFQGPAGNRIGLIYQVDGDRFIVEIDEPLVATMREEISRGNTPARCTVVSFKKEDKPNG